MSNFRQFPTSTHSRLLIMVLLVASMTFLARLIPEPRTIDDAFITFRYSRNLVNGEGFVYNSSNRTLGTTTPLYTLLMAGVGFVTGSEQFPWFALVTNALADSITAVLLVLIVFRITSRLLVAALTGMLWAIAPMSVTFAVGGMETSVVILWSVAAAFALFSGHERSVGLFGALGMLTRIDAIIWVGLLLGFQVLFRWQQARHQAAPTRAGLMRLLRTLPWQSWLVFMAALVPWYIFSWAYFGTLLSRSLSAKTVAYIVPDLHAFTRLLQHIATPFFAHETVGIPAIAVGLVLFPALALMGTLHAWKNHPRMVPYLLYPWPYVAIFSIMNPVIFRWYLAPILPAYFLAIVLGLWALLDNLNTAVKRPAFFPVAWSVSGILLIGFSLNAWELHPDHGPNRPAPKMAWHQIELYYREMGEYLRNDLGVTADTLVAAGDIGAVGFYSHARILDTVGLITPEMSDYYPLDKRILIEDANYAVPPAIIYDYEPEYIVFMEMFVRNGLARETRFEALYDEIRFIPTDFYGTGMIMYHHRATSNNK